MNNVISINKKTQKKTQTKKVRVWKYIETKKINGGQSVDNAFIETIKDLGMVMMPTAVSGSNALAYLKKGLVMINQREISETQMIWVYTNPHYGNNKFAMYLELMSIQSFINTRPHEELMIDDSEEGVVQYSLYF